MALSPAPPTTTRWRRPALVKSPRPGSSEAARAWRKGYYPIGEAVQLPEDAFHDEADKQAHESRNFALRGRLPTAARKNGLVRWQSGGSLTLPLMEAQQTYEVVARGGGTGPQGRSWVR
ncbi:hypothetical protein PV336_13360 [Streptomyces sp. MI02-2A]|uniref:hypothetical protein n=1 Tax=unclassified Streptomyces TaxID=2593676 RepID=UPI0026CE433F|nr:MULTISPECIES: hypothetical protein [unclassified Streptomyces]MDX3260204.1 hypothetical protein [Streptomyces sp. MI02-2A]